jgi:5-methylcytosine-specific restriction enzyme A
MVSRNPTWSRDELILSLEFYLQHNPSFPDKRSAEIAELSETLNALQTSLGGERGEKFRNTNGVYMKLMNFRRFDPDYNGAGLQRGGKDEEVVWDLFSQDRHRLTEAADKIRQFISSEAQEISSPVFDQNMDDEEDAEEGRLLTRVHKYRERDRDLVRRKKERELKRNGLLACDACGFDFKAAYGNRGDGFIECHHTKPVSELEPGSRTRLDELALVCANCHRMIHRVKPWLTIEELQNLLR